MSSYSMLNQLIGEFQQIKSGLNGKMSLPFNKARIEAIDHFSKLGFPTIRHEEWKYSNVKNIVGAEYNFHPKSDITKSELAPLHLPETAGNLLYFVNGVYHPELSNIVEAGKVIVMTIQEAKESNPEFLNKYYGEITNNTEEAFTAMNTALANDGVVIHVPANTSLEQPIILRMISDVREENVGCIIRNLIVVDKNAEVKIAEAYRTLGDKKAFVNTVSEIYVDQDARVDYYKIQSESDESSHIGTTQVYQKDKSYFYAATVTLNGGFIRNNLNLTQDGEYINSHMFGLYIPNGTQHIDNHTVVDHRKPNCESNELYKGILMDKSNGVFNGKIFVQQEAQKTNAYQNCRNVIVSDTATMNTKPQLEIWADDVKCSHGTTTGQLNDEAIFYMQSRGIPKAEAIKMQLLAFANDVITEIKIDSIREYLEEEIAKKLSNI